MFELYLDTADVTQVARFNQCLPLRGVTTNPSIVAAGGKGLGESLPALQAVLGNEARFHVQVVSHSVNAMFEEAQRLYELPFDIIVKVPATETGLQAIKKMKAANIKVLATAVYTAEQGFLAALCGADYLAPYVNRIQTLGVDGVQVVQNLQLLLEKHHLDSKILAASFKSAQQATAIMQLGVAAITLPVEVLEQMLHHPVLPGVVEKFDQDWRAAFAEKTADES